jgi:hypothetical protein
MMNKTVTVGTLVGSDYDVCVVVVKDACQVVVRLFGHIISVSVDVLDTSLVLLRK